MEKLPAHHVNVLNRTSSKGFAFNCLTSYSDAEKMRDHLYYADPCEVFDHCKRHYSHLGLIGKRYSLL